MAPRPNSVSKSLTYVLDSSADENDGHIGGVNALKYNGLSHHLFSGGRDGTVKIWEKESVDNQKNTHYSSEDLPNIEDSSDIDANNQFLNDISAKITKFGIPYQNFNSHYNLLSSGELHTGWVNDLEIVGNESLVSCSSDLLVKHWNYQTNTQTTLGYHNDYAMCLSLPNPNSSWIASGGLDKCIKTWDLRKNCLIESYDVSCSNSVSTLNFYNDQDKGSIYSMSANNNLIAYGGTENIISFIDTRASKTSAVKLVGHTDTVRSLILSDEWLLSGSSDSSIKLWSIKNNRVLRTFDMHNSSVWSLYSDYDDFRIFYSGDKDGYVFKSDLRGCFIESDYDESENELLTSRLNENLGIISLIAKQPRGINSIVVEDENADDKNNLNDKGKDIWCATNDNSLESFKNVNLKDLVLQQFLTMKTSLLNLLKNNNNLGDGIFDDDSDAYNEDIYDLVSQISLDNRTSMDRRPNSLSATSISLLDSFGETFKYDGETNNLFANNPEAGGIVFETSFTTITGSANGQYINIDEEEEEINDFFRLEVLTDPLPADVVTIAPINNDYHHRIEGNPAVIKARLLNDRRTLVTLNDSGIIRVWNAITGQIKKTFDNDDDDELDDDEDDEKYDLHLREHQEHKFEEIITAYQTKETVLNWCTVSVKIGKVFITMKENTFCNCEIYIDDMKGILEDDIINGINQENHNPLDEIRVNLGKVVLKSLLYNFVQECIKRDLEFRENIVKGKVDIKKTLKDSKYSVFEEERELKEKESNKDTTSEESSENTSNCNNDENNNNNNGGFKKFFGRKNKKEEKEHYTPNPPVNVTKSKESSIKSFKQNVNNNLSQSTYDDTLSYVMNRIFHSYLINPDLKVLNNSGFVLSSTKEIPIVNQLTINHVSILINESSNLLKGNSLNLYKFSSNLKKFDNETFGKIQESVPAWIGKAILKNDYGMKQIPKISFIIEEWKPENFEKEIENNNNNENKQKRRNSIFSKNDELPPLPSLDGVKSVRLNAYQVIRAKKIMFFILEKFTTKTPEMKKMFPYGQAKFENSIKAEDWLEILCNDEVLSPNMTLLTIKTMYWKSSGDVVLKYRRKLRK